MWAAYRAGMPAWSQVILDMFPRNAVAAFSNGKLLQVVIFALFIGITMISLGIIGSYIFRVYQEVLRRPRYLVTQEINLASLPR